MVGLKTDSNMWKIRLLVISYVTYWSFQSDTVIFMIERRPGYFARLHEIFFQVESDFNGIFVNLKPTTEGKDVTNITGSHKDN